MSTKSRTQASRKSVSSEAPVLDGRVLSARRDTVDFRDKMYVPTLVEGKR
jgi:hypothetical protein